MNARYAVVLLLGSVALSAEASPGDPLQVAIQKGVNYLAHDVRTFSQSNTCLACHRQGVALYGLSRAYAAGYTVDTSPMNGLGFLADRIVADQGLGGIWAHGLNLFSSSKTSYAMMGLAGYTRGVSTAQAPALIAASEYAITAQGTDGRWLEDHGQFPVTVGDVGATARMMMGLDAASTVVDASRAGAFAAALTNAAAWIVSLVNDPFSPELAQNHQVAYALLGLKAAGFANDDPAVVTLQNRLLGSVSLPSTRGWGYGVGNSADEFNTGLALYALCKSGKRLTDNGILTHAEWLNDRQQDVVVAGGPGGKWSTNAFNTDDVPTTFAMLGLSCFGNQGVSVTVLGESQQAIDVGSTAAQTRTFRVRIENTGAFAGSDDYDVLLYGAMPGWSLSSAQPVVHLATGTSTETTVTLVVPPNQPPSMPVVLCAHVTSEHTPSVTAYTRMVVYTDPAPPSAGVTTFTYLVAGNEAHVGDRLAPVRLAASVTGDGQPVVGPTQGLVTFLVGGLPIGNDNDADGDGVFEVQWTPGPGFHETCDQDLRAIYSGNDRPTGNDLLPSYAFGVIRLDLATDADNDGLADELEVTAVGTNPAVADTDGDGCLDGLEYHQMLSNPLTTDTDLDGVGDCVEHNLGTDPLRDTSFPDADGDAVSDGADPFPCDAEKSAVLFMPGEGQFGTLMFEDNWPKKGDLDFNDAVVAYNYAIYYNSAGAVSHVVLTLDPLAVGAHFHSGLALHVPVSGTSMESAVRSIGGVGQVPLATDEGETQVVVTIADDLRDLFAVPEGYINTEANAAMIDAPQVVVSLHFSPAVPLPRGEEPFDLYFFRSENKRHQVHRPPFAGTALMDGALFGTDDDASDLSPGGRRFVDGLGMPFVLAMPALVPWTKEFEDIAHLFPDIIEFATSGGTLRRDFYSSSVVGEWAYPPSLTLQNGQAQVSSIASFVPSRACTPVPPGG